ncbi:hypothetical protein GCM10027088_45010 [Nocardia goodfellowii]
MTVIIPFPGRRAAAVPSRSAHAGGGPYGDGAQGWRARSTRVGVQPATTAGSRRAEDRTTDKTDEKDAVLIARLTAQLRCYAPEPLDEAGRCRERSIHANRTRNK